MKPQFHYTFTNNMWIHAFSLCEQIISQRDLDSSKTNLNEWTIELKKRQYPSN